MSHHATHTFSKSSSTSPKIGLDEQIDRYARGLKSYIWSELCTTDYTSLEALMRDAERVESAKGTRFNPIQQNNGLFRPGPVAMELNATVAVQKLTPEEREKCMKEGICLRCREKGHMARWCPKTAKRN
jgi:hypothetical protein